MFDVKKIRRDFPILSSRVNGVPLVYLDNAATTQKPRAVLDALTRFYQRHNSNVHRGAHALATLATQDFENARQSVANFIGSSSTENVIWTRGATESANLIASSYADSILQKGDTLLISTLEHHANIVPWQQAASRKQAHVIPIPILATGEIDQAAYTQLLKQHKPRIVCLTHVSNALGVITPLESMIPQAKSAGATVVIDGSQAIAHLPIDVESLGCDFYFFSGHKCYGPTGIGVLWGRKTLLEAMPPWQCGGEMIKQVSFNGTTFAGIPHRFEAGTPPIADAIGFAAAIQYLQTLDRPAIAAYEATLREHALKELRTLPNIVIYAESASNVGILSFRFNDLQNQDVAMLLDQSGIAIRSGHHCAMPLMEALGCGGTLRASFAFYNTLEEVSSFCQALRLAVAMLREGSSTSRSTESHGQEPHFITPLSFTELQTTLTSFIDWQSRFNYLMSLGDQLPPLPMMFRTPAHHVTGCEANVWLVSEQLTDNHWRFAIDSDSRLIKGIAYLLLAGIQGQAKNDIQSFEITGLLEQCKLDHYLTPTRTNGIRAILSRIQEEICSK